MIHGPFFLKSELTDVCVVTSHGILEAGGVCGCDNSSISAALAYILKAFLKEDGLQVEVNNYMIWLFWWAGSGLWVHIFPPLGRILIEQALQLSEISVKYRT